MNKRRCIPTCSGCAQARRHPDDHFTRRTHQLMHPEEQEHFESLLLASKKAQAEILARIAAPLASCEELEARRAVGVLPEFDATPLTLEIPPAPRGDA